MRKLLLAGILTVLSFNKLLLSQIKVNVTETTTEQKEGAEISKDERATYFDEKNLITLKVYSFFNGFIGFNYERVLKPKHALQASLGATFSQDVFVELIPQIYGFEDEVFSLDAYDIKSIGPYYGFSYKFYPKGYYGFSGLYLSPAFSKRSYFLEQQDRLAGYSITDYVLRIGKMSDPYTMFGWNKGGRSELYIGFGLRKVNSNKHELQDPIDLYGYPIQQDEIWLNVKKTSFLPCIQIGFQVGFPF